MWIFLGDKNAFSVIERMKMERTYTYDNAIVHITIPNKSSQHIRKATEIFLKKVMLEKEKNQNGNTN